MRIPLTLLLALSFLVQSVPLSARADEVVIEPSVEVPPITEPPVEDIEPVLEIDIVVEPNPTPPDPVPVEDPTPVIEVPVIQTPVLQTEDEEYDSFTLEDTYLDIDGSVVLPDGCEVTDISGATHIFPTATTTEYLAACALAEAIEEDVISELTVTNSSFGLYVTSINDVAAGTNEYWAIWINDGYSDCGISCQELAAGDTISFVRTAYDPDTGIETQMDRVDLTVSALTDEYDNIMVPEACTATDIASTMHTFPAGEDLLGICALVAAQQAGILSGYELTNASFGLYVSGLDGGVLAADEYWALWLNGEYTSCGVACLPVEVGDTLSFVRTTFAEVESDRFDLRVIGHIEAVEPDTGTGEPGETPEDPAESFDTDAAYAFLTSLEDDGLIENELVTDWSAVAFAVSGAPRATRSAIASYLKTEEFSLETAADYERHAMALMALNINPYTGGPEDYITPIVDAFDGEQVGDSRYINDDVFALFPLLHAGYTKNDQIIKDITLYIVDEQSGNGSWENSVDMTAATVQALKPLSSLPGVASALEDAESYLRSEQGEDGGFGDAFATAWAMQAIEALGGSPESWSVGGNTPLTYLTELQEEDGGLSVSPSDDWNRAWATAYAIPAVEGATWHSLLEDFPKPATGSPVATDEEDEETVEEVIVEEVEEVVVPTEDPLAPAFTYDAPLEANRATIARATQLSAEAVVEEKATIEEPEAALTASAGSSGGGSWLMSMLGSLWEGIASFFKGIFS